jgi:hypothetical protein
VRERERENIGETHAVLDYKWLSMVAEIGGYVGLMLGVAVVDVTSVISKLYRRASS